MQNFHSPFLIIMAASYVLFTLVSAVLILNILIKISDDGKKGNYFIKIVRGAKRLYHRDRELMTIIVLLATNALLGSYYYHQFIFGCAISSKYGNTCGDLNNFTNVYGWISVLAITFFHLGAMIMAFSILRSKAKS